MSDLEFKLTIPKTDVINIIDLLDEFGELCARRGVKFRDYSPEQLMEVLLLYRNYKASGKAPF